jgi:hypothetical protein
MFEKILKVDQGVSHDAFRDKQEHENPSVFEEEVTED